MNPWHDVEPGAQAPELVDCIIEIPRGSRQKYELDKSSGLLRLDRVLYSAVFYPANYGFIPRTYCDDHDPLDILVLGQDPVVPMCILTARPIGVMQMVDSNEEDDKIIAIHEHDPAVAHLRDISDLPKHTLNELERFFTDYKILEQKVVRIERFKNCLEAQEIIESALKLYTDSFHEDGTKKADAPKLKSDMMREKSRVVSRSARLEAARRQAAHNASVPSEPATDDELVPLAVDSIVEADEPIDLRTLQSHAPREATPPETEASVAAASAPEVLGKLDTDGASPDGHVMPPIVADETRATVERARLHADVTSAAGSNGHTPSEN